MAKYEDRKNWLLSRMFKERYKYILTASEVADEFADEFGLSRAVYTLGPNCCPSMTRTLRQMADEGLVEKRTGGNQDAAKYMQKTYYTSFRLTKHGQQVAEELAETA